MTPLRPFIPPIGGGFWLEQPETSHDRVRLWKGSRPDGPDHAFRAIRSYHHNLRTGHVLEMRGGDNGR